MIANSDYFKNCCANLYESDWARLLLGDSFHPGGLLLTERLGIMLGIQPHHRVLDVASGKGTSALFLAQRFGCEVVGVDYGADSVAEAMETAVSTSSRQADSLNLISRVQFKQGDAEQLPFEDDSFDFVICECAFCTFPNKQIAANEFARVLKSGGQVGISDLTRNDSIPPELNNLLAWIACIADAQPIDDYLNYFAHAGVVVGQVEYHDNALLDMVYNIRKKLLGAELLVKLKKIELPGADFSQAKQMAKVAETAVREGKFGYALIVGHQG